MKNSKLNLVATSLFMSIFSIGAYAGSNEVDTVSDELIATQRLFLAANTIEEGFGPLSPRDIDKAGGANGRDFEAAPNYRDMNLCNIHIHGAAAHKGSEFTTYAGNGDGRGYGTGFLYSGTLTESELADVGIRIGKTEQGALTSGDTIEVHYVHNTAKVVPGPTLGACLSESILNTQLRVEIQVCVQANDDSALDFIELTTFDNVDEKYQALNIASNTGDAVQYAGSTTGPSYNLKGSQWQVSWSVRAQVTKVNIKTVGQWLESNVFDKDRLHLVRNLIVNPDILSETGS
jgi:hypothetical protein